MLSFGHSTVIENFWEFKTFSARKRLKEFPDTN